MPAYNAENVICKSIDSILSQTYTNFELLVINDGSTDRTNSIIDEFASSDNRIKTIHKSNGGASEARNYGLDIAKGKFITFCDADDFVYENWLEEMIKNSIDADIVVTGFVKDNKKVITKHGFKYKGSLRNILNDYPDLTMIGALWNKLFSRDIIEKNNLRLNEKLSFREDEEFVFRYLRYCINVSIIDSYTYHYYEPNWEKYNKQIASLSGFDMIVSLIKSLKIIGVRGCLYESGCYELAARCLHNCKHNPSKLLHYIRKYIDATDYRFITSLLQIIKKELRKCSIIRKFSL